MIEVRAMLTRQTTYGERPKRRLHPRHLFRARLLVMPAVETGLESFWGSTRDVSAGGLFINTERVLPVGTRLTAKLALGDGPLLRLAARVVYHAPRRGLGCALDELTPELVELSLQRLMPPTAYSVDALSTATSSSGG